MNDPVTNLLGLCRKAGKLSIGHDSCKPSINYRKAKICIFCSDASQRLKEEIEGLISNSGKNVRIIYSDYTMSDMKQALGVRTAVMTVDDEGFAKAIEKKLNDNETGEERDL